MSVYAIGDLQGCYEALCRLLELIHYDPALDQLWFAGDLVNRGPQSLATLRLIHSLPNTTVVLGNHDLHLLAVAAGVQTLRSDDTIRPILEAPEGEALCRWLRGQKFMHHDPELGYAMVHAGIPPMWSLNQALAYAQELESYLKDETLAWLLKQQYQALAPQWQANLAPSFKYTMLLYYFTRLRFCNIQGGVTEDHQQRPGTQPKGYVPWFTLNPERFTSKILFGHWSALAGKTHVPHIFALDTGCVWGGSLSALELMEDRWYHLPCPSY